MYCVYDGKAKFFEKPFFMRNNGEALRAWATVASDKSTSIGMYPADFSLFEIGSYDELSANVQMLEAKVNLGTAIEHSTSIEHRAPPISPVQNLSS